MDVAEKSLPRMIKKYPLLLVTAFIAILTSCKKDFEDFDKLDNQASSVDGAYLPLTPGTQWIYHGVAGFGGLTTEDTRTSTVTDETEIIKGIKYAVFDITSKTVGDSKGYMGYDKGIYLTLMANDASGDSGIVPFYAEGKKIGESYLQAYDFNANGQNYQGRYNLVTLEQGITLTVQGKAYTDVVHTSLTVEMFLLGQWQKASSVEFYIAKNIGIISTHSYVADMEIDRTELISFTKGK